MANSLAEYMSERKCGPFKPVPHYFSGGDYLSLYLTNDRCVAQRVDELLTVYLATDSKALVGFKIKGLKKLVEEADTFGIDLNAGNIKLRVLFFWGAALAKDATQKQYYYDLRRIVGDEVLDQLLQLA